MSYPIGDYPDNEDVQWPHFCAICGQPLEPILNQEQVGDIITDILVDSFCPSCEEGSVKNETNNISAVEIPF